MCLIIVQPAGHTLSRDHLRDVFTRNGDGFGIMRADKGTLRTWRIVTNNVQDMLDTYYRHAAGRACVLHWRMATHGEVNRDNAHPFSLTRDVAVAHNGMLDVGTPSRGMSDTWHMAQHVLAPIARDNADALFTSDMAVVLGGMIGTTNKLVFAHADGRVAIVNRASGVDYRGCWYSNTYAWDAPATLRPPTRYAGGRSAWWLDDADDTPAAPTAPACAPCAPGGAWHVDDDADPAELLHQCALDDLEERIAAGDVDGVRTWCDDYPNTAADVLTTAYEISRDDARAYLTTARDDVAGWLMAM